MRVRKKIYLGGNNNEKEYSPLGAVLFVVVGILFLALALFVDKANKDFIESAVETKAVISRIERDYSTSNGKTKTDYDVYVKYTVNGTTYERQLNYYNSGMDEGDEITVYYNPVNPTEMKGEQSMSVVFIIVPIFCIAFGAAFLISDLSKFIRRKKLMASGTKTTGIITDIHTNTRVKYNNRHPSKAECQVSDAFTGETFSCASEDVYRNINNLVGKSVDVYYDPKNPKKHYVDLNSAKESVTEENPWDNNYR